jgi:preprotein translocase subunit SecA
MVSRWIEKAQKRVEEYNFDMRKNVLEYDEVMDEQRKSVYAWRQKFVENRDVEPELLTLIEDAVGDGVDLYCPPRSRVEDRDLDGLAEWFGRRFGEPPQLSEEDRTDLRALERQLTALAKDLFERKAQAVGKEPFLDFGRFLALRTIDLKWKDHLHAMDVLRSGIGLRSYAQLDPKIEYKAEGGEMFEQMLIRIADEVTDLLFRVRVEEERERTMADIWQVSEERHDQLDPGAYARQQEEVADNAGAHIAARPVRVQQKVGRNQPCPCGSGKKFKHCCGRFSR